MEKMNLNASTFSGGRLLTRSQLKEVLGGSAQNECPDMCETDNDCPVGLICTYVPCAFPPQPVHRDCVEV